MILPLCKRSVKFSFRIYLEKKWKSISMKNMILRGTLLLTAAGMISRIMGFFYRIFLANVIGAEGMGIYQLIFPIYSVCFSLCASGIETAVSKLTAAKFATGKPQEAASILKIGILITLTLSISCSLIIYSYAEFIAKVFLKEPQCANLLKILSITIPFGTTQSCICGYYFGIHKAGVPSFAQLIEQTARIGCVFLLYNIYLTNKINITPVIAVIGLVFGEVISLIFTLTCFSFHPQKTVSKLKDYFFSNLKEITLLSTPLTISRISINLLGSLEAALIPHALKSYGMNSSTALSVYGILTGMALPFILFPNAVTGSISLMLLPAVSKSQAGGQLSTLKSTLQKSFTFCIMLGICCFFFFLLFGNLLGEFLFSSTMAGDFITVLAWICPFLYLNTTLSSVLNGLGKTGITFLNGIIGLFIRIGFIAFGIPHLGIHGYLFGLLASQLFLTASGIFFVHKSISSDKKCSDYRF